MKISLVHVASAAAIALVAMAGCSGGGSSTPGSAPGTVSGASGQVASAGHLPQPSTGMISLTTSAHVIPNIHRNKKKSWLSPDAKHFQYLLYVSDEATGTVNIYNYRSKPGKLYGQLTGFQFPYGSCVDASGNVYITDFAAGDIVEYAHGGTTPINTLTDSYGYPIGCSVNPTNGDLAVANFEGIGSTCMGGIVIYSGATGSGTLYQDQDYDYYWPPGYDPQGNLYVQGQTASNTTGMAELASGSSTLTSLTMSGASITYPGGVQWDGHYVTATDQQYQGGTISGIYRVTVSGTTATVVSSTPLGDDACMKGSVAYNDVVSPYLSGLAKFYRVGGPNRETVAGNLACSYRYNFWKYTGGGTPKRSLPYDLSPELASGQTVSRMQTGGK